MLFRSPSLGFTLGVLWQEGCDDEGAIRFARVRVGGVDIGTVRASGSDVFEGSLVVPSAAATDRAVVDLRVEGGTLSVAHYWFGLARDEAPR